MGAIWAVTARYVFASDPDLKPILSKLSPVTSAGTVERFRQELNNAVALEGKKNKDSHVFMFQTKVFNPIQKQGLNNAGALATAIQKALLDTHPERAKNPNYQAFVSRIEGFANNNSTVAKTEVVTGSPLETPAMAVSQTLAPGPAVPDPAPTDDLTAAEAAPGPATIAAPPAAAPVALAGTGAPGWVSWLALLLSVLSFAGMALLFRKQNQPAAAVAPTLLPASPERTNRPASKRETNVSWDEMRKFVERQMDERLSPAVAPAAAAPVAKSGAKPTPKASVSAAPAPAPEPEPDDFESFLAPLPASAPRQRMQYANEAPFNNSFPARALSDQPGTYSMFAIASSEQQPDQGTFAVTGNLASHVRDHRSVLEPVCEYVGGYPLGSESRVITVEPGQVRRRGDDWEVVQRAKVRFE
jgi:hypothetical protein